LEILFRPTRPANKLAKNVKEKLSGTAKPARSFLENFTFCLPNLFQMFHDSHLPRRQQALKEQGANSIAEKI